MPVLVRVGDQKAILRDGKWWSAHPLLERKLNQATDAWIRETGGPPLQDRNPERTVARAVIPSVGGRIALTVPAKEPAARRVYLSRRQLDLFAE